MFFFCAKKIQGHPLSSFCSNHKRQNGLYWNNERRRATSNPPCLFLLWREQIYWWNFKLSVLILFLRYAWKKKKKNTIIANSKELFIFRMQETDQCVFPAQGPLQCLSAAFWPQSEATWSRKRSDDRMRLVLILPALTCLQGHQRSVLSKSNNSTTLTPTLSLFFSSLTVTYN